MDRIILFGPDPQGRLTTLEQLVEEGKRFKEPTFQERRLRKDEGKTKIAFLSFSSGTTGRPKVRYHFRSNKQDLISL
jgi:4-coumarate--CoA ligase